MTPTPQPEPGFGSGHDRSARERDVLRELHELTGRPRTGEAPVREVAEPVAPEENPKRRRNPDAEQGEGPAR